MQGTSTRNICQAAIVAVMTAQSDPVDKPDVGCEGACAGRCLGDGDALVDLLRSPSRDF